LKRGEGSIGVRGKSPSETNLTNKKRSIGRGFFTIVPLPGRGQRGLRKGVVSEKKNWWAGKCFKKKSDKAV